MFNEIMVQTVSTLVGGLGVVAIVTGMKEGACLYSCNQTNTVTRLTLEIPPTGYRWLRRRLSRNGDQQIQRNPIPLLPVASQPTSATSCNNPRPIRDGIRRHSWRQ